MTSDKSQRASRVARQAARSEQKRSESRRTGGAERGAGGVAIAGSPDVERAEPRLTVTRIDQQYRANDAVATPRHPSGREKAEREAAIWYGGARATNEAERAPTEHVEGRPFIRWRVVSGVILLALAAALGVLFFGDGFYVRPNNVVISGLDTMTREEVYVLTNVADFHVFWIDPSLVRADLLRSPTIADAQVFIGWSPNMVQIVIDEREPALLWQRGEIETWIDLQGRVMRQRGERPDLLLLNDESREARDQVEAEIVNGALQMYQLLPDIAELRYSDAGGLGYTDSRGWDAWFGVGTNMPEKILIYNAIVDDLLEREIAPRVINVVNPDAPYYTVR